MTRIVRSNVDPLSTLNRSWMGFMTWSHLLFAHWPIDAGVMRALIPPQLTLDTFDGSAWVGVVPFTMSNVRPRCAPVAMPPFPELNVRTYVTYRGKPGVYFFSLDAASRLLVWGGRTFVSLPYFNADMGAATNAQGWTHFASTRTDRHAPPARWIARYRPTGAASRPTPRTLEHFLTERYCLYSTTTAGELLRCDVHHAPWPLQPAELETRHDTMLEQINLAPPDTPPLLHFAKGLDVHTWWPVRADR